MRSLKFDVDTKEDGTPLAGKNVQKGVFGFGTRQVTLGWFGLEPLKAGISQRNNEYAHADHKGKRSWNEKIAEMGGLLDCNASGLLCGKADNFFRRLKGCSMRSLYQSGGFGGCLQVAANSDWVKRIVANAGEDISDNDTRTVENNTAKVTRQVIWTFVLAELLKRHDARRYRNNVVRGLSEALGGKKDENFSNVLKFLHEVEKEELKAEKPATITPEATSSPDTPAKPSQREAKIKREISMAFESVYESFAPTSN